MKNKNEIYKKIISVTVTVISLLGTYYYILIGKYTRLIADDYCTLASLKKYGLLGTQLHYYMQWSGRFTFTFLISLIQLIGLWIVPYMPALIALFLFAALLFLFKNLLNDKSYPFTSMAISALTMFLILYSAPDILQSFYWNTGAITYTIPIIGLSLIMGVLLLHNNSKIILHSIFLFFLTYIFGGTVETYATIQMIVIILFAFYIFINNFKNLNIKIFIKPISSLIGSFLALLTIFIAPGNKVRQSFFPKPPNPYILITKTIENSHKYILSIRFNHSFVNSIILILIATTLLSFVTKKRDWSKKELQIGAFVLMISYFAIVLGTFAPSIWGTGQNPPDRTMFLTTSFFLINTAIMGIILGAILQKIIKGNYLLKKFLLLAVLIPIVTIIPVKNVASRYFTNRKNLIKYANEWDAQNSRIKKSKEKNILVTALGHTSNLADFTTNKDDWVNRCAANWYEKESIRTKN